MSARRFLLRDLLIDPENRWVIEDKGVTWITDRYVCVRADLFTKPPKAKGHGAGKGKDRLKVSSLRAMLGQFRGAGDILYSTDIRADHGSATVWRAGHALILLNGRVTRNLYLAGLRPRHIAGAKGVAWYRTIRGRQALYAVQMCKVPSGMEFKDLSGGAA